MVGPKRQPTAVRRPISAARTFAAGALSIRSESPDVRRRAQIMIVSTMIVLAVLTAAIATVLIDNAGSLISNAADQRGQHGVKLLVTVGVDMPNITPGLVNGGLSAAEDTQLDIAVNRGQQAGVLSELNIWNGRGDLVYSSNQELERRPPPDLEADLVRALHGKPTNDVEPHGYDASTDKRTGTQQAFQPMFAHGHVYGVVETDLPLAPIAAESAHVRDDILAFVIGGAVLLWLLTLPLTLRAAVGAARAWSPGRRKILAEFRRALDEREIELAYQPQIDATSGELHALEALVRWRQGDTLRPPDTFLPVIEETPLMTELTDRVIELATRQLASWRAAGCAVRVSINLSARDVEDETLAARIAVALARHGLDNDQLTVEVTETAILRDVALAQRVLTAIAELGVEVSVDDFGTGHASISRLHQLPIREVKIDRSFVTPADRRTRAYLTAMVRFAQSLGLRTVAEGVEDESTLVYLQALDCDLAQGYHITKPLPVDGIDEWLRTHGAVGQPKPLRLLAA
jgi:EAL domain-containing protein (putative c-di-GMP-specific phosphodiesterase class I)